jgi:hypothetical protein
MEQKIKSSYLTPFAIIIRREIYAKMLRELSKLTDKDLKNGAALTNLFMCQE